MLPKNGLDDEVYRRIPVAPACRRRETRHRKALPAGMQIGAAVNWIAVFQGEMRVAIPKKITVFVGKT
jgi:predicted CoA-binding protein